MKLGLALGLLLLLGLVISAPARLLTYVLPPGQVVLQGVSGTLWQGRAGSCLNILASDFEAVEAIREGINRSGLQAEMESSSARDDGVRARIRVGEAS